MMQKSLQFNVGIKTDPIEYRYSFSWLFRLLSEQGVTRVQLGTFLELYHLPDEYFGELRREAQGYGVQINSVFTAHRELGGFFIDDVRWCEVAYRNYRRLIDVGALLGASRVGSNPGAVWRDHFDYKPQGLRCYLTHMKELMKYAKQKGLQYLTIEPMSCRAEPPSSPEEIVRVAEELLSFHRAHPEETVPVGYCFDISHGFADEEGRVKWTPMELLEHALPYVVELHLKNTDARFHSTFGFSAEERQKGVVDIPQVVNFLKNHKAQLPVFELTGYLEISGPKLGRDYSDNRLKLALCESLDYVKNTFG
ncbi:MAG TPA: TIM barrel protein [Candidatus Hydrogenedentes bacterium]|nr:TIM barrel protein [Candidatus Hydrogenedentota bacterium]